MKKLTTLVLCLVLCTTKCTVIKSTSKVAEPITISKPVEVPSYIFITDTIKTVKFVDKYIPVYQTAYNIDSIVNYRMSSYIDSNSRLIASQSLVLEDYKNTLIYNVKLIDSIRQIKIEKSVLKHENVEKQQAINIINGIDYYIASAFYLSLVVMLLAVSLRQNKLRREILSELKT